MEKKNAEKKTTPIVVPAKRPTVVPHEDENMKISTSPMTARPPHPNKENILPSVEELLSSANFNKYIQSNEQKITTFVYPQEWGPNRM